MKYGGVQQILPCLVAWTLAKLTTGDRDTYGVIIDAGSSGSRVRLYRWTRKMAADGLPVFREFFSEKLEPGISSFKGDKLDGLEPYLRTLVDAAVGEIPESSVPDTAIYLMATAGMRLLLEPNANSVMERIQQVLSDPEICPFQFSRHQARILSGEEEGVFAWIAANYLHRYFDDPDGRESVGILELGGASTQIAFLPTGSILADKFPVRLAGRTYPVYVHSYLYYGQNYADRWVKEYLYRTGGHPTGVIDNPCMLKGDSITVNISNSLVAFSGSGDPRMCTEIIGHLVYKVEPYQCYPKPCAVGSVYQPSVSPDQPFFALSAFTYPLRTLQVLDENGAFSPAETLESAHVYCQKHIQVIINETQGKPEFMSVECLMGLYIPILFTKGYGFSNDTRQVAAKFTINGSPAEWTLGAAIYEAERQHIKTCSGAQTLPNSMMVTFNRSRNPYQTVYSTCLMCLILMCHQAFHVFHKSW